MHHKKFRACPSLRSGRAIRYKSSFANAHYGLFAAIPHAYTRVHTRYVPALGMRRACVSMVRGWWA